MFVFSFGGDADKTEVGQHDAADHPEHGGPILLFII